MLLLKCSSAPMEMILKKTIKSALAGSELWETIVVLEVLPLPLNFLMLLQINHGFKCKITPVTFKRFETIVA